ncbi:MAG: TetR/AcrR family transcriptional regulator [Clostridium sp.]
MNKLTNRQKQAIATKLKITQVATELFKEHGFENVKIQDICAKANISTGAFYHHFTSKHQIINTAYEHVDILVIERLKDKIFACNIDKIIGLLGEGGVLLDELGWIFVSDVYKNLLSLEKKYSFHPERYVTKEIKSTIELALKNGEFKEGISSEYLTQTLLRISRGSIFDWCLQQGSYDLKERIVSDLNLILLQFRASDSNSN